MPKNPQNTIIQNAFKNYNQFRSVRNDALRSLKITTDAEKKLKLATEAK